MSEVSKAEQRHSTLEGHFGFRDLPFGVAPDPRFFYGHSLYLEGLAALMHGIQSRKGFMLVTGEVGTGKTILLRKLMRQLDDSVRSVFVSNSHLTSYGLTELIVQSLQIGSKEQSRLEMLQDLNNYLVDQLAGGRAVALLIDEAQKLSDEALEGLCDLSNLETEQEKLLQIVLVGQPEIGTKLNKPSLRRIKQRIALHHRLYALQTPTEVEHYIRHRLNIAGYEGPDIFNKEAIEALWQYSGGTPRLINILCDNALAAACLSSKKKVSPYMVMKAAGGLMLEPGAEPLKMVSPERSPLRAKTPPSRSIPQRGELAGEAAAGAPGIPMRESDRMKMSQLAARGPSVSVHFFDRMTHAATEAMGPMAQRILGDQILALGESRQAFPQAKLAELILRMSGEILNETMRNHFQKTMINEMATLKNM